MATAADLQAAIDAIEAQLNSGVSQAAENGRMLRYDLASLRQRRAELIAQLNRLSGTPQIRRILTHSPTKGL